MIKIILATISIASLLSSRGKCQGADTLVDVGNRHLNFHIIKGNGIPILFDAGGGNDGTVWNNILQPVADITGTTVIAYDRAGFGKSRLDTNRHGIINEIEGLEAGLNKLGYKGKIMLVAHSLGGFYATLYASRHPAAVKAAVLIDANLSCFFTDEHILKNRAENKALMEKFKLENHLGLYYLFADLENTIGIMRKSAFPVNTPLIDIVAERPPFPDEAMSERWKACHREFAAASPSRESITALGAGHYVFRENPAMVIQAIIKQYAEIVDKPVRNEILARGVEYAIKASNEMKGQEIRYRHSEDDLNSWGYSLLKQNEKEKALEVLKLNVLLNPASANAYDSLAEIYEAMGNTPEAVRFYKRSLELNPQNKNAGERLKKLDKSTIY